MGEQQDAVLQVGHDRVEVLFQGGEDLFHVAHAPADALDLVRDQHHGVLGGGTDEGRRADQPPFFRGGQLGGLGGRGLEGVLLEARVLQSVEAQIDLLNRLESQVGEESRDDQRGQDGDAGVGERSPDPGFEDVAQEGGSDADADGEKRHLLPVGERSFQRQTML